MGPVVRDEVVLVRMRTRRWSSDSLTFHLAETRPRAREKKQQQEGAGPVARRKHWSGSSESRTCLEGAASDS